MIKNKTLIIGQGLDNIKFGITDKELINIMGNPDEREEDSEEGFETLTLYYDNPSIDFSFDMDESENKLILTCISLSDPDFNLENKITLGMTIEEVKNQMKALKAEDPEYSTDDIEPETEILNYENESLILWFEKGMLSTIQAGLLWMDDETPVLPE